MDRAGRRERGGGRHHHCWTSPIYREKVRAINGELARRYGEHPALRLWHVSNEYDGQWFCPLCVEAFRRWLRERHGSLETLNKAYWADGTEETRPLIAYYYHPPGPEGAEGWIAESGVQDWWPSFPHFCNATAKMHRVAGDSQSPEDWRYLYTMQWTNPQPDRDLKEITVRHLPESETKLAVLAVTSLAPG